MERLSTPVLLIIFNRPEVTQRAIEALRVVQPTKVLLAADGPRDQHEAVICERTRQLALNAIDWDCDLSTNFAYDNLGCGVRVYTAIDWVFEAHDEAIILEDDCIPHPSFFDFCQQLLNRYEAHSRVMHISGNNFHSKGESGGPGSTDSYYFSKYPHAWGWATWKRAWEKFDWKIRDWPTLEESDLLGQWCDDRFERAHWKAIFDQMLGGKEDVWDYQWVYACWKNGGLSIVPTKNLVSNIGYGIDATHTKERNIFLERATQEIESIVHPECINRNTKADKRTFDRNFGGQELRLEMSMAHRIKHLGTRVLHRLLRALRRQ